MGVWKMTCAGGGQMGVEEEGLCCSLSLCREGGRREVHFWGVQWLRLCVVVGREEVDPWTGPLDWSLDGTGIASAQGVEDRRGVVPWADLKRFKKKNVNITSTYCTCTTKNCKFDATE